MQNHPPLFWRAFLSIISILIFSTDTSPGGTAYPMGPSMAGQIHAVAFDAEDPSTIYVGGDTFGISKTTNLGDTWQFYNVGLENRHGGASMYVEDLLSLKQTDVPLGSPTLYAATRGGIYCRTGADWELMTPPDTHGFGYTLGTDPTIRYSMIQYSSLAYDGSRYLYAGAGHARWDEKLPQSFYTLVPNDRYNQVLQGESAQYSLWVCDLQGSGQWEPVLLTEGMGPVRDLTFFRDESGVDHAVFATPGGVWDYRIAFPALVELTTPTKLYPDPPLWSHNTWGVAFDASGRLFILNMRKTEEEEANTPGVYMTDLSDTGKIEFVGDRNALIKTGTTEMTLETYLTMTDLDGVIIDLTTLALRDNDDGSVDLVIGNRDGAEPGNGGGYLNARIAPGQAMDAVIWNNMLRFSSWGTMVTLPMDSDPAHEQTLAASELGWVGDDNPHNGNNGCPAITPTVEFGFSPHNDQHLLAWMYAFPLLSTDEGDTWRRYTVTDQNPPDGPAVAATRCLPEI